MNHIATLNEKVLDYLIKVRQKTSEFYFVPRKINNKGRLDDGYWFIGNDEYLHVSFWNGMDWKERIHNIGFVVHEDKTSNIELSAQDSPEKAGFLQKVAATLPGYVKMRGKNKWFKHFSGKDYLATLTQFIEEDKPVIDTLLAMERPKGITFLDKRFYDKYILRVLELRKKQVEYGATHKITRLTWNTHRWQRPSGPSGKSQNMDAYEAISGFGHEEWLLDKTAIIKGCHYGFIQSLNIDSDRHVGNIYEITIFTINNLGKKYEVGKLYNVECISGEESENIYQEYLDNGWIAKMERDLQRENADVRKFRQTPPNRFFNIKFRLNEAIIHEEMPEIRKDDINITTNHFKLLPKKNLEGAFVPLEEIDNGGNGNRKNTNKRKKIYNVECEYDPYHDEMQNALFDLLNSGHEGYREVKIEHGRVDIKARSTDGEWHYFEIKTDGPKLSIRKALGQVMEYAYYPDLEQAKRLLIIADAIPDPDSIRYLQYLRDRFNLPVWFRAFDKNTRILSAEF